MTISLDTVFMDAIESSQSLLTAFGGRRWCTAAPMPLDAFIENVSPPYVIVKFDGFSNEGGTKDDPYDGGYDRVNISVTVAARNNEELSSLAQAVREAVHGYLTAHDGEEGIPYDTQVTGGQKAYDEEKPCFWIDLNWSCSADSGI